jgi:hypothetical protein
MICVKNESIYPDAQPREKTILKLPIRNHRIYKRWAPAMAVNARATISRSRAPFYQNEETIIRMVLNKKDLPFGTLTVLNNLRFNQHNGANTVFLFFQSRSTKLYSFG